MVGGLFRQGCSANHNPESLQILPGLVGPQTAPDPTPWLDRLETWATSWRVVLVTTVLVAITIPWLAIGPITDVEPHGGILDDQWGLTPTEAYDALAAMGSDGRTAYRTFLIWDLAYPLLYAPALALIIAGGTRTLLRTRHPLRYVIALPLVAGAMDWLENLGYLVALARFPDSQGGIAWATTVASHLKYALISVAVTLAILSIVSLLVQAVMDPMGRRRKSRR